MKKSFLFAVATLLLCSTQLSAYTVYYHPIEDALNGTKFAAMSAASEEDLYDPAKYVWSDWMTPVSGHDGWYQTDIPEDNVWLRFCSFQSGATVPSDEEFRTYYAHETWNLNCDKVKVHYLHMAYVGWIPSFEDLFDDESGDQRKLLNNMFYTLDKSTHQAAVAAGSSVFRPTGSLTIPNTVSYKGENYSVTAIGNEAFWGCSDVTSITFPEGLKSIGNYAFVETALTSVSLPEGLTSLGYDVFGGSQLEQITIPNSITDLSAGALYGCDSLVSVTLGTGVDTIGNDAFYGSNKIARLTIYAPAPPKVDATAHPALVSTCSLMVPSSAKAAYKAHPYWSQFEIKGIYIVTFKDFSGNTIKTDAVEEGQAAVAPEASEVEGYDFKGWDVAFNNVTSDLVVNAVYEIKHFTVRFLNIAGDPIKTETVDWNKNATAPDAPEVEGYHFVAWDPANFTHIKANLDVQATYAINTYSVTFVDWNDAVLKEAQVVNWHAAAVAPADPEREGYDFKGWDKAFNSVTEDLVVKATYEIKHFSVVFKNGDVILKDTIVDWNTAAIAPADPTREGHTFTGWSPAEFSNVTSDMVIIAQFAINKYTVRFFGWDNELLNTQTVDWNTAAEAPAEPSHEGYDFKGWDTDFSSVKSDLDVKAKFEIKHFTVIFKDWDGTILKAEQVVNWNEAAKAPENPHRDYYTFNGWDQAFDHVQSDLVVTAVYLPGEDADVIVRFFGKDGAGEELANTPVVIRIPAAPAIEGFTFLYWRPVAERIQGSIKIEAVYEENDPTAAPEVYVNPANKAQKLVRDGQVYILRDNKTYTINGQLVK